jgi:hypothetical protein
MLFRVLRRDFWGFTLAFDGEVQGNDGTATLDIFNNKMD